MLKRIYRSTPPEVIVEVLEPYVHLTTANVRIIKNRTGPMGHTYGFIDLDSHAVSFPHLAVAWGQLATGTSSRSDGYFLICGILMCHLVS